MTALMTYRDFPTLAERKLEDVQVSITQNGSDKCAIKFSLNSGDVGATVTIYRRRPRLYSLFNYDETVTEALQAMNIGASERLRISEELHDFVELINGEEALANV